MRGKDAKRCKRCKYHTSISGGEIICYYIGMTDKPRGCMPGLDCTKFEPEDGNTVKKKIAAINPYLVRPEEKKTRTCKGCYHRMTKYRDGKIISYCPLLGEEVDPDVTVCRIIP